VVGLALAATLACAGRRHRELRIRAAGTIACAACAVALCVLAARHPAGLDLSAARRNSLTGETRAVLAELPGPATLTIVEPTLGALAPIYDEVARVAAQLADAAPGVAVRRADPARVPGGLTAIARAAGLAAGDLASGGSIVVELGGRQRVVDLLGFAAIDRGPDGAPVVERLAIEQALAGALAALSAVRPVAVCATRGHGELALAAGPAGHDWAAVAERLRADGMTIQEVDVAPAVPASCTVLVVAGPSQPLGDAEALAIQRFVQGGRGLVVAAGGPTAGGLPATGLEGLLAAERIGLPPAIAIDPALAVRELPGALFVIDGYADHPINRGFARARATLWLQPRAVIAAAAATALVSASAASWGERDLVAPPRKDADDLAGPVALAALGSAHRVIAIGSAESLASSVLSGGASAADLWLARAIRFASGTPEPAIAAGRAPAQIRLIMTPGERRAVVALSVAGIPVAWLVLGGLVVWWRRRGR
jgi:hypothetical protein